MFVLVKEANPLSERNSRFDCKVAIQDGLNVYYSTDKLINVYCNDSYFMLHRGLPVFDDERFKNIIKLYEKQSKKDKFKLITGSYFLILFDKEENALRIYRDAWGSVPVFYEKERMIISDSISEIVACIPESKLNNKVLCEYLACSYIVGAPTLYSNILALEPRNMLEFKNQDLSTRQNHNYPKFDKDLRINDLVVELEEAIDKSINNIFTAIADPEEFFIALSGGTDSSLLTAKLYEKYDHKKFICGTVHYENWHLNDTEYFRRVIDQYKLDGYIESINNENYANALVDLINSSKYIYHTFSPSFFSLANSINSKYPKIKYQINGTGPDEGIIGFEKIPMAEMLANNNLKKEQWIKFLFEKLDYIYTPPEIIYSIVNEGGDILSSRMKIANNLLNTCDHFSEFQRRYTFETVTDHHIRMLYHIAQLNNIETIYPYCTQEIFAISFKAPYSELNLNEIYKAVYKRILLKYFGEEFVYRPKIGFHAPSRVYFKEGKGLGAKLSGINLADMQKLFNLEEVKKQINHRLNDKDAILDYLLWTFLNFSLWFIRLSSG